MLFFAIEFIASFGAFFLIKEKEDSYRLSTQSIALLEKSPQHFDPIEMDRPMVWHCERYFHSVRAIVFQQTNSVNQILEEMKERDENTFSSDFPHFQPFGPIPPAIEFNAFKFDRTNEMDPRRGGKHDHNESEAKI